MRMFFTLALVLGMVSACPKPTGEPPSVPLIPTTLAGTWQGSGQGPTAPDGTPGMNWAVDLSLSDATYVRDGYPPWEERATIQRVVHTEQTFTLHVTDHVRNGDTMEDGVLTLTLSEDGQQLTLDGFVLTRAPSP